MRSACVYWIREPQHTDIFNQGYVGVSLDVNKRIKTHINRAKNKLHGNKNLLEYLDSNFIVETIIVSNEDYCYDIEAKLRPEKSIGWNINAGGVKPPSQLGIKRKEKYGKTWSPMQGKNHSEDTKKKMSEASRGKPKSEEHKVKMSLTRKGMYTQERLHKMSIAKKGIPTGISYTKNKLWWNNGVINKMSTNQPDSSFTRGRIKKIKGN